MKSRHVVPNPVQYSANGAREMSKVSLAKCFRLASSNSFEYLHTGELACIVCPNA